MCGAVAAFSAPSVVMLGLIPVSAIFWAKTAKLLDSQRRLKKWDSQY